MESHRRHRRQKKDYWSTLRIPAELAAKILCLLPFRSAVRAKLVCRWMRYLVDTHVPTTRVLYTVPMDRAHSGGGRSPFFEWCLGQRGCQLDAVAFRLPPATALRPVYMFLGGDSQGPCAGTVPWAAGIRIPGVQPFDQEVSLGAEHPIHSPWIYVPLEASRSRNLRPDGALPGGLQ